MCYILVLFSLKNRAFSSLDTKACYSTLYLGVNYAFGQLCSHCWLNLVILTIFYQLFLEHTAEHSAHTQNQVLINPYSVMFHLQWKLQLCLVHLHKRLMERNQRMKTVERREGVKKRNRRSVKSVTGTKSMKGVRSLIPLMTGGNTGKTRRGDMILTEEFLKLKMLCNVPSFYWCFKKFICNFARASLSCIYGY